VFNIWRCIDTTLHNDIGDKMQRGQVILEFIFIILIVVIYIFTVTKPFMANSQETIFDIEALTRTNAETQKITNSINKLSLLGIGSKETLEIFLPAQSKILCNTSNNTFGFIVEINSSENSPEHNLCPDNTCEKTFALNDTVVLACDVPELSDRETIEVEKQSGVIRVGGVVT
jgi:uncharacterized protein (UPF0333 family)